MEINTGDIICISKEAFDLIKDQSIKDFIIRKMNKDEIAFNTSYVVHAKRGIYGKAAGVYYSLAGQYLTMYKFKTQKSNSHFYPETIVRIVRKVEQEDNLINIWTKTL